MRLGNREYRIVLLVITVVFALPLVMHIINGFNARMLADDYCFSADALIRGLPGAMDYYYYNWQGIFSATAAQGIVGILGGWVNPLLPALLIVVWWLGLVYVFWQLCGLLNFRQVGLSAVALSTVVLYAILEGTPNVYQSIYWTSGSMTYGLPITLFTFWCGILLQISRTQLSTVKAVVVGIVAGVTGGLLAGFSPIFAAFALQVVVFALIAVWVRKAEQKWALTTLLGLALIGMLVGAVIIIAAPGNAVRQALFEKPAGLLALLGVNLTGTAAFISIDLSTFSLVPHLVLLVVGGWLVSSGFAETSTAYNRIKRNSRKWMWGVVALALVLMFGIFIPTSYNISGFPPGRALLIPHVVMVAVVLTWGAIFGISLKKSISVNWISRFMMVIMVTLMVVGPLRATLKSLEISPNLQTFAAEWDARDASLRAAAANGNMTISVPKFSIDLANYVNVGEAEGSEFGNCLNRYYDLEHVTIES